MCYIKTQKFSRIKFRWKNFVRNIFGHFFANFSRKFYTVGKNFELKNVIDLVKGQFLRDSLSKF